ncbi:hypothetical protein TD95_004495 [Thielaviopsis punctulata]|uniref:ERCC1-like central domain-containing protein n=1 Tax=Thielaviopsis punctulata TaxID=72032 RepID=A0A0F4ZG75_9PEZI|nr:hypothetical protein TD95_004495 [Thielaviopsis punctulata]
MADDFDDFPDDLLMQALETPPTQARSSLSGAQPGRVQQPAPQRLSRLGPAASAAAGPVGNKDKVVQPKPQVLPKPSLGSSIIVSMRQKGNPLLSNFKKCPWEYGDIPADYVMGVTTCALFLSLKYHRLHPEYIYKRIQDLQGRYQLRIILALVDITDHHDSLRELSKTSLVNNVTLICCWSAKEAAHYIETYKLSEHSDFTLIKGQKVGNYAERVYNFVTAVPSLNRSEAMSLLLKCGSLRAGVNADADTLSAIGGWGDVKVKRWRETVEEPFRQRKAGKMDILSVPGRTAEESARAAKRAAVLERAVPVGARNGAEHVVAGDGGSETAKKENSVESVREKQQTSSTLSGGVAAALAKLRQS